MQPPRIRNVRRGNGMNRWNPEAFRYFLLEQAEGWLVAHDGPLLKPSATPPAAAAPFSLPS